MRRWLKARKQLVEIGVYCAGQGQLVEATADVLTHLYFVGKDARRARDLLVRDIGRAMALKEMTIEEQAIAKVMKSELLNRFFGYIFLDAETEADYRFILEAGDEALLGMVGRPASSALNDLRMSKFLV